jgi:hypothetical protein
MIKVTFIVKLTEAKTAVYKADQLFCYQTYLTVYMVGRSVETYSKPSTNAQLSKADYIIIHVKKNSNNYLLKAENSFVCGVPNTL